jgi:TPP-dependent indolepyruvate ferredoxin oxidoreductase alpha subunit
MGDFTSVDKVKSLFRRIKIEAETGDEKTNTVVTIEEVDEFILETETSIKARLATCYDTSSIGADSVIILGKITRYFVADTIRNIMALTSGNSDRKTQEMGDGWGAKAKEMLDAICPPENCGDCKEKPSMPLPDTPLINSSPTSASLFNSSNNTPQFTKSGNNW